MDGTLILYNNSFIQVVFSRRHFVAILRVKFSFEKGGGGGAEMEMIIFGVFLVYLDII